MVIWTLAKKDLRLLVRDARAIIILLAMPLVFILVLGVSLGENFGREPAYKLRVTVLKEDVGLPRGPAISPGAWQTFAGVGLAHIDPSTPRQSWTERFLHDINETADIRLEFVESREEAERLVRTGKRAAVLIIGKDFSNRVEQCSFLAQGVNPLYRDGVKLDRLDVEILEDPTQPTAVAIIHQVAQGSLMRVTLPWMIGRAFEKIGEPVFLDLLAKEKGLPWAVTLFLNSPASEKKALSSSLQGAVQNIFPRYELTAKTWAAMTREKESYSGKDQQNTEYKEDGSGLLKRGGSRYQLLVPSFLVMFTFFMVLTVGWLFVAERRQGTLKRLVVAPLTKSEILLGKMLPCLMLSLFQGSFLLAAGHWIFGMDVGTEPGWLFLLVPATSFAAIGLAMLLASLARTETQVAIYGTLLVLVLAMLSVALMVDPGLRDSESMQVISLLNPLAWALEAYKQLLSNPQPERMIVLKACAVLVGFGAGFLAIAWWCLKLDDA
jgi:ABC-type multidrug transport system permease subunit